MRQPWGENHCMTNEEDRNDGGGSGEGRGGGGRQKSLGQQDERTSV